MLAWPRLLHTSLHVGGIHRRLLIWGLGLFGLGLTVIVAASYYYTLRQIERDVAQLQNEIASVAAQYIRDFLRRKIERFSDTASAVNLYPLGSKEQELLLSLLVKNDSSFNEATIIDARGMEVLKVSDRRVYFPSDLSDQSKSAKFNHAIKGEDYISPVYTSDRFQPYVTIAIPLWGASQSVVGVAAAQADLSVLWEVIGKIRFGAAGHGYLVDGQGNLIAHKDASLVVKKPNLRHVSKVSEFLRDPTRPDPAPGRRGRGVVDADVLATYAPVPDLGWAIILEEPVEAALANAEKLKRYVSAFLIFGLIIGTAAIGWVSRRITGPIRELHQGAKIIGSGNLDYRVKIETGDEIEWLGQEFNKMAEELKFSYATLEQKVKDKTAELARANSELEEANAELVMANRAKDEFLSVMSHELRTPLNVIMGYSQMLKYGVLGTLNPEQQRALDKIIARSKDLLHMIVEILQVASIEAGRVKLEVRQFDLAEMLDELRTTYEIPLDKDLRLIWEHSPERIPLRTDRDKLRDILQNLIDNAIKFTEGGQITVAARYLPESAVAEIKIADTGIGIERSLLPSIFEMFRQLDSSAKRNHEGAGVGLYIVKKYTEMLGGEIHVESEVGQGSVFTLTIPA
ncbi:MAG TPA: sensor histidine kinase [Candidatus Eisenbacteria bacterium]|nr:sensor histidine kinase [Candidatus Eisenbacteria bacterium]